MTKELRKSEVYCALQVKRTKSPHTFKDLYEDFGIEDKLPTN